MRFEGREISVKGYTVLIDSEDFDRVVSRCWWVRVDGSGNPRIVSKGNLYLSRFITGCVKGDGAVVDHLNHNTLDNRKRNLKITDRAGNTRNRLAVKGSTSCYRGVSWDEQKGLWRARAQFEGKHFHLGRFENEKDASNAVEDFWCEISR